MKIGCMIGPVIGLLVLMNSKISFAQERSIKEINRLEQLELASVLKADTTSLLKLWSKDFICNNPYGSIVTPSEVIKFINAGQIDYSSYNRHVERVTFTANLAIVMGKEVVVPQNNTPGAGKTITMRYTHVWINSEGKWRLVARQASNF